MTKPRIITLGCRLNAFETEVMRGHAESCGLDDAVIINTCAVTGEATRQARQIVRRARRENPSARIVVTGCAAQIDPHMFAAMPEVDVVLGNDEKLKRENYAGRKRANGEPDVRVGDIMAVKKTTRTLIPGLKDKTRAFVQIQNGCDHRCTFCIIPFGRGPSRSVPPNQVVDQIQALVDVGYKEVVLCGVDITAYGGDLPGQLSLGGLAIEILEFIPGLARLRLSSIDIVEADAALFDLLASEPRLMPHLHLSLQAGDDLILKRMKRRHTSEQAIAFCDRVRAVRGDITFGADLIAGFPTETGEMFANTLRIIDACGLTFLHVFPFSPRPGTPAASMPQVDGKTIRERARALREKGAIRLQRHLTALTGTICPVLAETDRRGHTPQFTPVEFEGAQIAGAIIETEMVSDVDGHMVGRPVQ